jgi:hypothetical protein
LAEQWARGEVIPTTMQRLGVKVLWGTPMGRDYKDTPGADVPENGILARPVYNEETRMWPTPRFTNSEQRTYARTPSQDAGRRGKYLPVEAGQTQIMKLNSAWVSRMMGYPDSWMDVGEVTR